MANNRSSKKRILIAERNRVRNSAYKSSVRTAIKKAQALVAGSADATAVTEAFRAVQSLSDRAVLKGIVSKNKAARDKARLAAVIAKNA